MLSFHKGLKLMIEQPKKMDIEYLWLFIQHTIYNFYEPLSKWFSVHFLSKLFIEQKEQDEKCLLAKS